MSDDNGSDDSDSFVLADLITHENARRPGVSLDDDHDQDEAPHGEIDDTTAKSDNLQQGRKNQLRMARTNSVRSKRN